jgi:hypothetical protein
MLHVGLAVALGHQRLDRQADQPVRGVAGQRGELLVGEDDPAVLVGDQDRVRKGLGERRWSGVEYGCGEDWWRLRSMTAAGGG